MFCVATVAIAICCWYLLFKRYHKDGPLYIHFHTPLIGRAVDTSQEADELAKVLMVPWYELTSTEQGLWPFLNVMIREDEPFTHDLGKLWYKVKQAIEDNDGPFRAYVSPAHMHPRFSISYSLL